MNSAIEIDDLKRTRAMTTDWEAAKRITIHKIDSAMVGLLSMCTDRTCDGKNLCTGFVLSRFRLRSAAGGCFIICDKESLTGELVASDTSMWNEISIDAKMDALNGVSTHLRSLFEG